MRELKQAYGRDDGGAISRTTAINRAIHAECPGGNEALGSMNYFFRLAEKRGWDRGQVRTFHSQAYDRLNRARLLLPVHKSNVAINEVPERRLIAFQLTCRRILPFAFRDQLHGCELVGVSVGKVRTVDAFGTRLEVMPSRRSPGEDPSADFGLDSRPVHDRPPNGPPSAKTPSAPTIDVFIGRAAQSAVLSSDKQLSWLPVSDRQELLANRPLM